MEREKLFFTKFLQSSLTILIISVIINNEYV